MKRVQCCFIISNDGLTSLVIYTNRNLNAFLYQFDDFLVFLQTTFHSDHECLSSFPSRFLRRNLRDCRLANIEIPIYVDK